MTKTFNIFKTIINRFNILLLGIVVFQIPIYHKFLSPIIGLWVLTSIALIIILKQKFIINKSQLTLIGFYLLLIIGLIWTNNQKAGVFDLEVKMSLIIFPLIFSFLNYSKAYVKFVLYCFLLGILIAEVYLFYSSYQQYRINHSINSFFYVNLSTIIHPSYLSLYIVTAMLIILVDLKTRVLNLFKKDLFSIVLIAFLFLFNMLILSKIGIIVGFILILFFTIHWLIAKKKYVYGFVIILVLLFSFYASYQKSSYVKQRVNEFVVGLTATEGEATNSSTGIRFKIWKQGVLLIKESPILGHGTGDVKDVLMEKYKLNRIESAYIRKYNAHNQFIQISISLGLIGLFCFLLVFYFGISESINMKNYFTFGFLIISFIFMLPESILENQAGTVFFGLFYSILLQKSFLLKKI